MLLHYSCVYHFIAVQGFRSKFLPHHLAKPWPPRHQLVNSSPLCICFIFDFFDFFFLLLFCNSIKTAGRRLEGKGFQLFWPHLLRFCEMCDFKGNFWKFCDLQNEAMCRKGAKPAARESNVHANGLVSLLIMETGETRTNIQRACLHFVH